MTREEAGKAFNKESIYQKNLDAVNSMMHHGTPLSGKERNCAFLNRGDGSFATISALSGYDAPDDGRGLALMDWDFDGRMDFWASARTAPRVRFMHNRLKQTGHWIGLKLQGSGKSNRDAIGARMTVKLTSGRILLRTVRAGEGFVSQSTKWLHLGLGKKAEIQSLSVRWPSGETETINTVAINAYYTLTQGEGRLKKYQAPSRMALAEKPTPLMKEKGTGMVRAPLRMPVPAPALRYIRAGKAEIFSGTPGRPTLINLWSQSCKICRHELDEFSRDRSKLADKVNVLALCIDPAATDHQQAEQFLKKLDFPWQAGVPSVGTMELLASVFSSSFPMKQNLPAPASLLVSGDGEIVALYTRPITTQELLEDVAKLASRPLTTHQRDSAVSPLGGYWLKRPTDINLLYLPRLMMKHGLIDDASAYVRKAHSQLGKHKEYAKLLVWIAEEQMKRGNKKEGVTFYNNALSAGKNKPFVLNNIAWVLATHADADVRNGKLALQVAHRCCKLTEFKEPAYLDTLGAAYAEEGDFKSAIVVIQHGLKLAREQNKAELVESLEKAMSLYRAGKPMR